MALDKIVDSTQLDSDLTSVANAIRTKGGTSASLAFPSGFVSAVQAIPSGGGGATVVASGTFIGNNNTVSGYGGRQFIAVGNKMPRTDFYLRFAAKDGEVFPYDTSYKYCSGIFGLFNEDGYFDLSSTGIKDVTKSSLSVDVDNSGTITSVQIGSYFGWTETIRNAGIGNTTAATWCKVERGNDGFSIIFGLSNPAYKFPPVEYEWELVYFGSNPSTDIVEIS